MKSELVYAQGTVKELNALMVVPRVQTELSLEKEDVLNPAPSEKWQDYSEPD